MPESLKQLPPKECLPKMISYLAHKYPEKPHDQIVAISASECGVSRKDTYGMDYGIQAAMWLSHYKEKYPYLNVKDQLRHAYQAIKKQTDFYDSFEEKSLEHVLLQVAEDFEENKKIKDAYEAISDACSLLPHDAKLKIASDWYDFRTSEIGKDFSCDLFYEFVAYNVYNFVEDFVVSEVQTTDFEIECSEQEFFENRIMNYVNTIIYYDTIPSESVKNERKAKLAKAFKTMRGQKKDFGFTTDSLDECLAYYKKEGKSDEEAKKICFASMNKAQTKATKKAKEKVPSEYDISYVKKNKLSADDRRKLEYIDISVKDFPKQIFKKINPRILVLSKLTDHPSFEDEVPSFYREVGINRTYKKVPGCYRTQTNTCYISLDNNDTPYNFHNTITHEIAHSVWDYGEVPHWIKDMLETEIETSKSFIKDKYYHKPTEMFALLFELDPKWLKEGWLQKRFSMKQKFMTYAETNESVADRFMKIYEYIRSWLGE